MSDRNKSKDQLIEEIRRLRSRVAVLERTCDSGLDRLGDLEVLCLALDNAPYGSVVASTSPSGEILYVNREFTVITGYTREDVPTVERWLEGAYPDPAYREEVVRNWEVDVGEPGRDVVYRVTCKDGSERELLLRAALLPGERMVVTLMDVSESNRTLRGLREREERYRLLIDSHPLGMVVHRRGEILYANPAALELIRASSEGEVIGRRLQYLLPDELQEASRARMASLYRGEQETTRAEVRVVRIDGTSFEAEVASKMIEWQGRPAGLTVATDITARRRAEAERRQLEERIADTQRMESLAVLAGGVAHDFNNLLVGILGNADLCLMELPPEAPSRTYLKGIELSARRAADLAQQMLAYSGKGRFVIDRLELDTLIQEISHLMEASISKKIVLKYDFADNVLPITGDATQIRQVVMNLITNASEAIGDRSGVITISTGTSELGPKDRPKLLLDDEIEPGLYSYFEVRDTGSGMDDFTRRRIFDPFFTTKFTGRGLGLAAVLGIVRGHQGLITVSSQPGKGSTFRVLLPAVEPEELMSDDSGSEQIQVGHQNKGTILLIDDEETVRTVAATMLRLGGYQVITARDGHTAVTKFARHADTIDCVLLDLSMPNMDGEETFRELRRIRDDVKVILSSGYSEQEASLRFGEDELSGFIQKPFRTSELMGKIREILG